MKKTLASTKISLLQAVSSFWSANNHFYKPPSQNSTASVQQIAIFTSCQDSTAACQQAKQTLECWSVP
jgi:hypothetical protein